MKITTIYFAALLFLYSCAPIPHSLNPRATYTSLTEVSRANSDTIPIATFFEGEPLNFNYSKIGLIEITGGHSVSTVLDNFKYHAWKNGGNSVLLIKKERIESGGTSYTDTCGNTTYSTSYTNRWTGMVTLMADSIHDSYVNESNGSKVIRTVETKAANTRPNNGPPVLVMLGAVTGMLVLTYRTE